MTSSIALADPDHRAVREDYELERGGHLRWLAWLDAADADAAVDVAVAAAVAAVAADAAADTVDAADAAADAADADDVTAAGYRNKINIDLKAEPDMRDGLKIIVSPGGRYYTLTQIGWVKHVQGDEYDFIGCRSITTTDDYRPLAELAATGLGKHAKLGPAAVIPEELHRLLLRRVLPCVESAWANECPKPEGWGT